MDTLSSHTTPGLGAPQVPAAEAASTPGLRVHYVLKRYPRTSETFVVRELLGLEQAGATVTIDALLPPEDAPMPPDAAAVRGVVRYLPRRPALREPGVFGVHARLAVRRPLIWWRRASAARRAGTWRRFVQAGLVADRARDAGADHLHAHFATAAAEVARDAAALAGLPFTVTAHAKDVFHTDNAPLLAERVAGAAAVVTVSGYNVAHLQQVLPGVPVAQVANGVAITEDAGPDPTGPILCVARMVDKKGIDVLLTAFARLSLDRPHARLELIGGGERAADYLAMARQLGVGGKVTFRGALPYDQVAAAYRRAAMAVLPCRVAASGDRDGMPTSLVEAAGHGLPVVATDVVGVGELVRDGVTGLLVPPEDAPALAAALTRLLDDPALARRLGEAGRRLVAERYDPAAATAALLDVFETARPDGPVRGQR